MLRFRSLTRNIKFKSDDVIAAVTVAQRHHAEGVLKTLQPYAPPKSPTTYTRTGDLGRAWNITQHISNSGLTARVNNSMFYATWVYGDEQGNNQQEQHEETGWKLAHDYADREDYRRAIQDAINHVVK